MKLAVVILLAVLSAWWAGGTEADTLGYYEASVTRVIDGDTVEASVELWPGIYAKSSIRIYGIDTPEIRGKCEQEKMLAQDAKRFVENWTKEPVVIHDVQPDKYGGRVLARVTVHGKDLGQMLVEAGLARVYYGEKKAAWCSE